MSAIKGKNTALEVTIRKAIFAKGFRYFLHVKRLAGKPDLVFPKYRAVLFIHGCFWHGHDCRLFRMPSTNAEKWSAKIDGNRQRDAKNIAALTDNGYRVGVVWECAVRDKSVKEFAQIIDHVCCWLNSSNAFGEFRG